MTPGHLRIGAPCFSTMKLQRHLLSAQQRATAALPCHGHFSVIQRESGKMLNHNGTHWGLKRVLLGDNINRFLYSHPNSCLLPAQRDTIQLLRSGKSGLDFALASFSYINYQQIWCDSWDLLLPGNICSSNVKPWGLKLILLRYTANQRNRQ